MIGLVAAGLTRTENLTKPLATSKLATKACRNCVIAPVSFSTEALLSTTSA
jgi:hypothetical protein